MEDESLELKEHISGLSDEELLEMVTDKAGEYRDEAIYFAKKELAARHIEIPKESGDESIKEGQVESSPLFRESSSTVSDELVVCMICGGKLRQGTLVAEKEMTVVFSDNQEERFVKVNACTQCGNVLMTVDYETAVDK